MGKVVLFLVLMWNFQVLYFNVKVVDRLTVHLISIVQLDLLKCTLGEIVLGLSSDK